MKLLNMLALELLELLESLKLLESELLEPLDPLKMLESEPLEPLEPRSKTAGIAHAVFGCTFQNSLQIIIMVNPVLVCACIILHRRNVFQITAKRFESLHMFRGKIMTAFSKNIYLENVKEKETRCFGRVSSMV